MFLNLSKVSITYIIDIVASIAFTDERKYFKK